MARTLNRQPFTTRSIDYDDTNYKFFGYSDWKGKCTNKNFIGVDQETFEDCSNVYIDRDNVLRSRPALKAGYKTDSSIPNSSIEQVYTFGQWKVYKMTYTDTTCKLYITDGTKSLNVTEEVALDAKIIFADEKIFVFANNYAMYVDTAADELTYADATNFIYSPVTTTITTSGVNDLESPNVWSKTHRERYIWTRNAPVDMTKIVDKQVEIQIGEDKDTITNVTHFEKNQEYVVAKKYSTEFTHDTLYFPRYSSTSDLRTTNVEYAIPMFDVSQYNSVLMARCVTKIVNNVSYRYYEISYAVDGVTFIPLAALPWTDATPYNCYHVPKFSKDGTMISVYTSVGVYVISVLTDSTDTTYKYPAWTNICEAYETTWDGGFTEFGDAYVYSYNTFVVYTGIVKNYAYIFCQEGIVEYPGDNPLFPFDDETVTVPIDTEYYSQVICNTDFFVHVMSGTSNDNTLMAIIAYDGRESTGKWSTVKLDDLPINNYETLLNVQLYDNGLLNVILPDYDTNTYSNYSYALPNGKTEYELVKTDYSIPKGSRLVAGSINNLLSRFVYYLNQSAILLPVSEYLTAPIAVVNGYLYYAIGLRDDSTSTYQLYTTKFDDNVYFTVTVNDSETIDYRYDYVAELSQFYVSKGKNVYITSKGAYTNNDFDWYLAEDYRKTFDYDVTGLHPISTSEVAVFTEDNLYYIVPATATIDEQETVVYNYYKSRIPLGCNKGSDIITSYDGKYTIFSTKRGLVAMAYQDFINSTEQALTFLSDNISETYFDWNTGAVKLTLFKYWLIVYRLDTEYAFVYDMRNGSWWPIQYGIVQQVLELDRKLAVVSRNKVYLPDTGDNDYKDDYYGNIKWSLLSQKLHFDAINYYKSVNNITLSSVMTSLPDASNPFTCNMRVTTYRKIMDGTQLPETMSFYVDMIRTYVKKLNYIKLGQFQYELSSDDDNVQQKPLSLTSIVIKYKATGQVR